MYCVKCGVELADSEKKCPLCGTPVFHPDIPRNLSDPPFPPDRRIRPEDVNRSGILFVLTVAALLPALLCLLCDWRINGTLVWSGYAAGAIGLLYIVILLPMWFRHPNPVIFVPVDFVAVGLYLLYINFATGGHWFLSFAFPVTGAIGLLVSAAVALTYYLRGGYLYICGGMLILGGGLAVLIEFLINLTFQIHETLFWSFYPMVAGVVLGLMLIVIAICKPLRESLRRPAVVICPGGAYEFCSVRESDAPASAFLNMGLQVFILLYSCGEAAGGKQPLTEAAQSVRLVRERADEWWIDPQKILICGFSAGGHLAASLGVHWDDPALAERCGVQDASVLRPDAMVLGYPVITAGQYAHRNSIVNVSRASGEPEQYWSLEENVSEKTPPTFLWHTMTDNSVPVENSLLFVQQLHRYGVACECHLFESGRHGMSVATREVDAASRAVHAWVGLCQTWLTARFGPLGGDAE